MELRDFIPKWTDAVTLADNEHIKSSIPEYKFPEYQHDTRIEYYEEHAELNFAHVAHGVVTEAWNWNSKYFNRDITRDFCETCNTLEKEPAYNAITKGGKYFDDFKATLWKHFNEEHKEIIFAFDQIAA